jgi:mannitol-specific phosphotransferase system IIBC component
MALTRLAVKAAAGVVVAAVVVAVSAAHVLKAWKHLAKARDPCQHRKMPPQKPKPKAWSHATATTPTTVSRVKSVRVTATAVTAARVATAHSATSSLKTVFLNCLPQMRCLTQRPSQNRSSKRAMLCTRMQQPL